MDLLDPAAADHKIAIIEHGGLTGRYGPLRLVEFDFDALTGAGS